MNTVEIAEADMVDKLVKAFMNLRRISDLVIDLTVYIINAKQKAQFKKNVRDVAYTICRGQVGELYEGEVVSVPMYEIMPEDIKTMLAISEFINKHKKPISLHLLIDEKNNKFGFGMVDYK